MFKIHCPTITLSCLSIALFWHAPLSASTPPSESLPTLESRGEKPNGSTLKIRTTAYTHTESDHLEYGKLAAAGNTLRHGKINSAAADWSRIPFGTKFKIMGRDELYIVDDYGSALVDRDVIDLYQPTESAMNQWGAREVEIEWIEWGCFKKSLEILEPRVEKAAHVRRMVENLKEKKLIEI